MDNNLDDNDSHSEIEISNSDPIKTVEHEDNISSFMKSSRASVKVTHDSYRVRLRIASSQRRLKYKFFEYLLYVVTAAILLLKVIIKLFYDNSVEAIFEYQSRVSKVSNLLRPIGFIVKEASKHNAAILTNASTRDAKFGQIHLDYQIFHYGVRLNIQIIQLLQFYTQDFNFDTDHTFLPDSSHS